MVKAGIVFSVTLLLGWSPSLSEARQIGPGGRGGPGALGGRGRGAAPQGDLVDALLRLPTAPPSPEASRGQRPQYTRESPPPDDAPLEDLARYWVSRATIGEAKRAALSDKTRERLFEAAVAFPNSANYLLDLLPKTAAVHDRMKHLYDEQRRPAGTEWDGMFRAYLMRNTPYLREELVRDASAAADHPKYPHVEKGEELEMLAAADFARAEPILKKFADDPMPRRAVLAKALLFEFGPNGPDSDRLNLELQKIVLDKDALGDSRDRALQSLLAREWPGREEWFMGLYREPSLKMVRDTNSMRSPLCQRTWSDPDHWVPVLTKLVGNADRAVHDNAVQCLSQFIDGRDTSRRDAVQPLLPWLLDPQWSSAYENVSPSGRLRLIQTVPLFGLRESIPGLIAVLSQGAGKFTDMTFRGYAAQSLGRFKASEAAPALREALASTAGPSSNSFDGDGPYRRMMMEALVEIGAVTGAEAVSALEAYASTVGQSGLEAIMMATMGFGNSRSALPDPVIMGQLLAQTQTAPSETTLGLILARVAELETTAPQTASQMLEIAHRWPSAPGDRDIARRIAANTAQAANIQLALSHRDKFRENAAEALRSSASSTGFPSGIFAVLSGDRQREENVLKGTDIAAIRAVLASARLAGESLPFDAVDRVYNSGDAAVERAAEAYLTTNDSAGARKILNARFKGTVILGAGETDDGSGRPPNNPFARQEQQLLARMQGPNAPDEVFAVLRLSSSEWSNATPTDQIIIEHRGDAATLTSQGTSVKGGSRALSAEEFGKLKAFIDSENVEELGPVSALVFDYTLLVEYVHLTPTSGRRVYMRNLGFGDTGGSVHEKLVSQFFGLVR